MAEKYRSTGFLAVVKMENVEEEDADVVAITQPVRTDQKSGSVIWRDHGPPVVAKAPAARPSISTSGSAPGVSGAPMGSASAQDPNAKAGSATYIPAVLHDYYRQASAVYRIDYTCALCSKALKCRSARDMRDHALSHGGAHWASAFRCLLCTYHSHSRRSVAKHVTTAHLIPDGVQCTPGELMENEIFSRQDELLDLVRDCFPLPHTPSPNRVHPPNAVGGFAVTHDRLDNGNGMISETDMALPVETNGATMVGAAPNGSMSGVLERYGGERRMKSDAFAITEASGGSGDCDYEEGAAWAGDASDQNGDEGAASSSKGALGVLEGWTVIEDGGDSDMVPEYSNVAQDPEMQKSKTTFPNYQPTFAKTSTPCHQRKTTSSSAPVLEGLLRDFQFQPDSFTMARPQEAPAPRAAFCAPAPTAPQEPDDPRALIERLLNVVAPDVARFLLEEAIRARAVAANTHSAARSVPTIESVTGSVSVVGPMRRIGAPTAVAAPARQPTAMAPRAAGGLAAAVNRLKQDRLGKIGAFKCPECQSIFKRRRYLERHVRARHRLHCYRCTMYGCSFTNARELWYVRRHHAKHHAHETALICRFCSKRFPNSDEITSRQHDCCSLLPRKGASTSSTSTQAVTNGSSTC